MFTIHFEENTEDPNIWADLTCVDSDGATSATSFENNLDCIDYNVPSHECDASTSPPVVHSYAYKMCFDETLYLSEYQLMRFGNKCIVTDTGTGPDSMQEGIMEQDYHQAQHEVYKTVRHFRMKHASLLGLTIKETNPFNIPEDQSTWP